MKETAINWRSGKVLAWDLDSFDLEKSIDSQIDLLKEDLVQVRFGNAVLLDLGWYPEFSSNGQFVLSVVKFNDWLNPKSEEWDNPVSQSKFHNPAELVQNLSCAVNIAVREADQ